MSQIGTVYGEALYALSAEENRSGETLQQLQALQQSFAAEPAFLELLSSPALSKQERCAVLDSSFQGKLDVFVLNFLKLLTEKGYIRRFSDCFRAYERKYNLENNILPVTAVTAAPLSEDQSRRLTEKLTAMTGKTIVLTNRIDPGCLGGIRLDYDGKRLDDTVANRLEQIRRHLKKAAL